MTQKMRAFIEGVVTAIVAHSGAFIAVATTDRLLHILGHVVVAVAMQIADRR
jgi:hypothetical protein